jgi:hypothetical protein
MTPPSWPHIDPLHATPPLRPPTSGERQPCQPEAHVRNRGCRACEAWEHGSVLLTDGRTLAKARWVQAHAAPPDKEEEVL